MAAEGVGAASSAPGSTSRIAKKEEQNVAEVPDSSAPATELTTKGKLQRHLQKKGKKASSNK